jgi:hypothetical protein
MMTMSVPQGCNDTNEGGMVRDVNVVERKDICVLNSRTPAREAGNGVAGKEMGNLESLSR